MEKALEDLFVKEFNVKIEDLIDQEKKVIGWLEERKLLNYKSLWMMNLFLIKKLQRLLAQDRPSSFFQDSIQSLDKEVKNIILLSTEWFSDGGTNDQNLIKADFEIDSQVLENLWESHYSQIYHTFWLFSSENANYRDIKDAYQRTLFNMYEYCGVPEVELDYFFEEDFQLYISLIYSIVESISKSNYEFCYDLLTKHFGFPVSKNTISTQDELDELILASPEEYENLILFCLNQFTRVRRCTEALIESLFVPEAPSPNAKLKGDGVASIREFELFNELLKDTLKNEINLINSKHLKSLQNYLLAVSDETIKGSGFKGMAQRQLSFLKNFNPIAENEAFQKMTVQERIKAVQDRNKDMQDISAFHRLKFALELRDSLKVNEQNIFYEKLASIVQNSSVNVYSDIIELYLYFLFKASGVQIEMLTAKTAHGQIISTCDYKFGAAVAADCKCIITDSMKMHHISTWCDKIGSQIKSTIGHENVSFGGGVIALRDQGIDFLRPLREFTGDPNVNQEEAHRILEWILKIHAEFRRHARLHAEHVKFVVLYYLPATAVEIDDLKSVNEFTVMNFLESLSVFTTKYANDEEFAEISQIFGPIAHYIFRFNNSFN